MAVENNRIRPIAVISTGRRSSWRLPCHRLGVVRPSCGHLVAFLRLPCAGLRPDSGSIRICSPMRAPSDMGLALGAGCCRLLSAAIGCCPSDSSWHQSGRGGPSRAVDTVRLSDVLPYLLRPLLLSGIQGMQPYCPLHAQP